ncbi:MAG: Gfo/Idh/MocA family oxidoreductase [Clostridia bacterium]|nr:Gfo/Idh/MocA family oxidoreductase [Clostridia bacterium]
MKEIRLGIIGTGKISAQLADAARAAGGYTLASLLSRDRARGEAFAAENGIARTFTDEEAFLTSGLDAVYVATPNCHHAHGAIAAATHGLHVLCEKPVAANADEWRAMRQAAKEHGVVLLEAMRPLHDPLLGLLQEKLPAIGKLRHVRLEYCQYSSRYDAFRTGEVLRAFDPRYGNAAIMDIGVYCVAVAAYLFGAPRTVQATSVFLENGFEGGGEALLSYDGFTVSIGYSKITASANPSCFLGEDGSLTLDKLNSPGRVVLSTRAGGEEQLPYTPLANNMVHELRDFAALIAQGDTAHRWQTASDITIDILDRIREASGITFA